jgi:hypothetical protein
VFPIRPRHVDCCDRPREAEATFFFRTAFPYQHVKVSLQLSECCTCHCQQRRLVSKTLLTRRTINDERRQHVLRFLPVSGRLVWLRRVHEARKCPASPSIDRLGRTRL